MAEHNPDEYKNVKFYAEHTTAKQSGFSKFKVEKDFYFCRYIDGDIAMLSQAYTSEAGRDNGIESVKKNETQARRYRFLSHGANQYGFSLKAGNGQEIAISPNYASQGRAQQVSSRLSGSAGAGQSAPRQAAPRKAAPRKAALAKVAAKPRAASTEQNYMPLPFYRNATKGKTAGFETFKGKDGEYYFTYFENDKIALISEGYPTAAIRDKGLASVEKNMKIESRYVYGKWDDGKEGFALRAGNNKEIARSVGYGSAAAASAGAAYLLGKRRRVSPKPASTRTATARVAPAKPRVVKPKPIKKTAAPVKASAKPKPVKAKVKRSSAPLAAGSVVVAGLGASAAAAKASAVKKATVPVKAAPIKAAPIKAAPVKAAPIAAAALGTAAVAGAAAMAAKPKAKPIAAAPVAAAASTPVAAPVAAAAAVSAAPVAAAIPAAAGAGGAGIWGWLKWVLMALIALLAMFFLIKACAGGGKEIKAALPATTTTTAASAAMVSCWNGSKAKNDKACPTKVTCWDDSFAVSQSTCPVQPVAKEFKCWNGSMAVDQAGCAIKPQPVAKLTTAAVTSSSVEGRVCAPSSNVLFNVTGSSPKSVSLLGTNPQFGESLSLTPDGFYRKLAAAYQTNQPDRAFLNLVARSLGYGSFRDMDASMFSNDTLSNGTSGLLGFGSQHALQYSSLNVTDTSNLEAFKVRSANGTDVHFMKRCGNFMYVCQP